MTQKGLSNGYLVFGFAFISSLGLTILLVQSSWVHLWLTLLTGVWPLYLTVALPGVQGFLTARKALKDETYPQFIKKIDLICAGLLGTAMVIMVVGRLSFIGLFFGAVLAAIATLPLIVTATIQLIQSIRHKRHPWHQAAKLLLQGSALLIYGVISVWASYLLIFWIGGEPYMGN